MELHKEQTFFRRFLTDIKVGLFLARRDILRSNKWTTSLIVFIMVLTFLNLVAVSGILEGLIQGAIDARHKYASGDVSISPFLNQTSIPHTDQILKIVQSLPGYKDHTVRFVSSAQVESSYRETIKEGLTRDVVGASLIGIDPSSEIRFSGLDKRMLEGQFLDDSDTDSVMVGKNLLYKYTPIEDPSFKNLKDVEIGSKIRVTLGKESKEYIIKGVIRSKVEYDSSIVMLNSEVRKLSGNDSFEAGQISVKIADNIAPESARDQLIASGVSGYARVQTFTEAIPKTVLDMKDTFAVLGTMLSAIGLAVSSVTIFIVIFVNAVTRRRFIGILKGIGITNRAIEVSYVAQAVFYSILGSIIGFIFTFVILKPFVAQNPIDFPFSDGILVASYATTFIRGLVLIACTIISGYIPARLIVKQNTLSAILGR